MKYYSILLLSFLIISCGDVNHGYGWEYDYKHNGLRVRGETMLTPDEIYTEYEKAVQCFGDKPPPFIIFTHNILKNNHDGLKNNWCGETYSDPPPLIILVSACEGQKRWLIHELVHYFVTPKHNQGFSNGLICMSN